MMNPSWTGPPCTVSDHQLPFQGLVKYTLLIRQVRLFYLPPIDLKCFSGWLWLAEIVLYYIMPGSNETTSYALFYHTIIYEISRR